MPAPADGTLTEVLQQEGATVTAGQVLARIESPAPGEQRMHSSTPKGNGTDAQVLAAAPIVSPSAQKLMSEHGLVPGAVSGSGKGGRVLKEDVLRTLAAATAAPAESKRPAKPASTPA